ncbi:MAG TPA: polyamine aminopropyltransferase [Bacteriovoracaceae bacterium]|nr:polyamine aminopropyltransferase [Bacteriovoracaceae bacterium]
MQLLLLLSVFVIATCGLIYELIAGTLASYLLGDSITQFSTIIGVYLFSMGIGSYLSKFITKNLIGVFIQVEILIGLIGGLSATILFVSFEYVTSFRILLYGIVCLTGTFVGLEIPLLMRILEKKYEFKELVSKVFTFDYIGALLASILFPLVLVPHLGLVRTAFMFGILNVLVGLWTIFIFKETIPYLRFLKGEAIAILLVLTAGFVYSDRILSFSESNSYPDTVIYSKSTKYQRMVLTKGPNDLRLFLNGNLQFSSRDEYRYHEALVHVGLASLTDPKRVLVLGGGDGLAIREVLKYPTVEKITLVDLDPDMTKLFKGHDALTDLNQDALSSSKVEIVNEDAFIWLKSNQVKYDFIIVDLPDPSNFSIGKLYTNTFYQSVKSSMAPAAVVVVQSTSPYVAKKSFWTVDATLKSTGLKTTPYHVFVPAFGDWGYIIATAHEFVVPTQLPAGLKFLNADVVSSMLVFPEDMTVESSQVNKLNNQVLVRIFDEEWANYVQ